MSDGMVSSSVKKILLLGKNGQIGWELQRTLASLGELIATDRTELDLTKLEQITAVVDRIKPAIVINAAAYTAVDGAEIEKEAAMKINGHAPGKLAEACKKNGSALIHYSTDFVFDGLHNSPYREDHKPSPLNYYGETKLSGEEAIQAVGGDYLIIRTSWIYGLRGRNFLLAMLKLAEEREEIRVVDDQVGIPNWCRAIAEATARLVKDLLLCSAKNEEGPDFKSGIYHLSASGEANWYRFATEIFSLFPGQRRVMKRLIPISTSEYPTLAKRPAYPVLDCSKINDRFGVKIENWLDILKRVSESAV